MSGLAPYSAYKQPGFAPASVSFAEKFWPVVGFLLAAGSSIVQHEPAPYDLLLIGAMMLFVFSGQPLPKGLSWPGLAVLLVLLGYAIGALSAVFQTDAINYLRTSTYLSLSMLFYAAIIWRMPERVAPLIGNGLIIASFIAAVLGIAGYFGMIPNAESYALYGRATGSFKDPNVFAPSLIFPAIYIVHRLTIKNVWETLWGVPVLLVLLGALFLSFSRGAWMNFIVAMSIFLFLTSIYGERKVRGRLMGFSVILLIIAAAALVFLLSIPGVRRLFIARFQLSQDYDSAEGGRYDNMAAAFRTALTHPFGIGPDQWPHISAANLMPHDVYVNVFVSGGLISIIGFIGILALTIWVGFRALKFRPPCQGILIAALGTLVGHILEGFIIDSNHWRHLYIVAGLIWGLALAAESRPGARATAPPF